MRTLASVVSLALLTSLAGSTTWRSVLAADGFRDDFSAYSEGANGAPRWTISGGDWKVLGGKLTQAAEGEGLAVTADAGVRGSRRIEVRFRTTAGNPGGGVLFGLTDGRGAADCHVVHEYHHQVDAFFNQSGHLDYPLNHPDPTVEPGRYGQHWDLNAFYLRTWPEESWFLSRFGTVRLADDADDDGVPDADASLPIDETRLGSDPQKADTDADGLSDLDEALAGTFRGADPRRPDTDDDGARDGADRFPLAAAFQADAEIPRGAPTIDGAWAGGEWRELGRAAEAGVVAGMRWDGDAVYLAVRAARPVRVAFEVDARNDGWFLEDDNAFAELEVTGEATPPVHGAPGARSAGSGGESAPVAEVALPPSWAPALVRKERTRFGLCVRVTWREGEGEAARDREVFLASPWELVEMELAGPAR